MAEPSAPSKPLDLAVLMDFGVRLHLFTPERGEEVRARLRERLGKAHTPLMIAEWLEVSPGELDQLLRAVRRLPRECADAELVTAFRRTPTEEGLLAVGTPRQASPPPPVPDARSVSIGRDVFSDPALPTVSQPTPRKLEWGRAVDLWTRMSLITPAAGAALLEKIGAQPIDALTPAALAGWLGVHDTTLEAMLRLAKTLPDEVTTQAAREAFDRARQADPHDLGTIEFGINTPSSAFLKPFMPPEVPPLSAPMRPCEEETKIVAAPPPPSPEAPPPPAASPSAEPNPVALPAGVDMPTAMEALARSLIATGLVGADADATALARKILERWIVELRTEGGPTSPAAP